MCRSSVGLIVGAGAGVLDWFDDGVWLGIEVDVLQLGDMDGLFVDMCIIWQYLQTC